MRRTNKRVLALALAVTAAAVVAGTTLTIAGAAAVDETVIHACRHPNGGWLRLVSEASACRARERAVSWNSQGPAGPQGEPGPAGPTGPPGPAGEPGKGIESLGDLNGIPCTRDGGGAGKVELDLAGDDTVLLRCVAGDAPPPPPPPGGGKLVINEIDYDQVGTDGDGFVEIHNTGDSAAQLDGLALVFVNGGDSTEYHREALSGSLAAGGYLVVDFDAQNGAPDGLALVDTAAGVLVDALSYEGTIPDAKIGTATYNLVEGTALPATVADSNEAAGSLIRNPNGKDTNDAASDWAFTTTLTKGAANVFTSGG